MRLRIIGTICSIFIFSGLINVDAAEDDSDMKISSPYFENNEPIPARFTCQGQDVNPALVFEDIPEGTQSLVLIVDDPDAPSGTWVHWVVFDMPVVSKIDEDSLQGKLGRNDFGRNEYGGPCPPSGVHRYFFKLYALDTMLNLNAGISKAELEAAMQEHILSQAELIGVYEKS